MEKKRVLVAVVDYPDNNGSVALMYVHVRNIFYQKNGICVSVLNFSAKQDYIIDGVKVITLETYERDRECLYDMLVCHAANIRNHYIFLRKHGKRFNRFMFFFHGHEVLKINETYSKPYEYVKNSKFQCYLQNIYDDFKLFLWRKYYLSVIDKSRYVFVSRWMLDEFLRWTKISFEKIEEKCSITYNCIGVPFEKAVYDWKTEKKYDFITVRGNLDGSKYCIDIVNDLAKKNPSKKFLIVGKGVFFSHYDKAENVEWKNQTMNHEEILQYLQLSRCALMPTRTDAQGLMMCEMASIGIPLITSDISVCHEVFDDFDNVCYIPNDTQDIDLDSMLKQLLNKLPYSKHDKYYNGNTSMAEVKMIQSLLE